MPQLIDLSVDIYQGMNVYPGHLKTVVFQHATHEETSQRFEGGFSFQTMGFMMNDNGPTHVDAFSHFDPNPDALSIDQMPLELFYGDAICLDVSSCEPETDIDSEHLERALTSSGLELRQGDIVLLYTATFNRYGDSPQYLSQFPGLGESGSAWLVEKGVKTFGVDTPTPDNPTSRTYPCHMMCRRHSITHYENLANLDQVAGKRFTFIGLPLKIRGGHGGPTRAIAVLE